MFLPKAVFLFFFLWLFLIFVENGGGCLATGIQSSPGSERDGNWQVGMCFHFKVTRLWSSCSEETPLLENCVVEILGVFQPEVNYFILDFKCLGPNLSF